jgi:hypothetical protein
MVTVFQQVRQTRMLSSCSRGFSLFFNDSLSLVLDLDMFGILGRCAASYPTLSARIGQRCHDGDRPHESKEHHCRR